MIEEVVSIKRRRFACSSIFFWLLFLLNTEKKWGQKTCVCEWLWVLKKGNLTENNGKLACNHIQHNVRKQIVRSLAVKQLVMRSENPLYNMYKVLTQICIIAKSFRCMHMYKKRINKLYARLLNNSNKRWIRLDTFV